MNALMADGLSHLDCAKSGVEYFIKKRNNQRDDKYMVLTYAEGTDSIKARIRDPMPFLLEKVKNLSAHDMFNGGLALGSIFDQLGLYRTLQDMDSFGLGRRPWASEPAVVFWFTDGAAMLQPSGVGDKLNIPGCVAPGAERYLEPFRWDYRLYTVYLDGATQIPDEPQINAMCEVMGGAAVHVGSLRIFQQCIDTMLGQAKPKDALPGTPFVAQPHGVLVNFDCLTGDQSRRFGRSYHKLISLAGGGGRNAGFFPIPEMYWPDDTAPPPRKAQPTILFNPVHMPINIPQGFPFDKYVVEVCPLTQELLKQPPNVYWQVFVPNSYKSPGAGFPFGFLKANSLQTIVNLYILPYNYPALFILLENLKKSTSQTPSAKWYRDFEEYLNHTPLYYLSFLRNALHLYGLATVANMQWGPEIVRMVKRMEMLRAASRSDAERMIVAAKRMFLPSTRVLKTEMDEGAVVTANAFDVPRSELVARLYRIKAAFALDCVTPPAQARTTEDLADADRHSVSIASMGNFQTTMNRNIEQELRDPLADEEQVKLQRRTMFGNPYVRLDKRSALDNVNDDITLDISESRENEAPAPSPRPGRTRYRRIRQLSSHGGSGTFAWPIAATGPICPPLKSPRPTTTPATTTTLPLPTLVPTRPPSPPDVIMAGPTPKEPLTRITTGPSAAPVPIVATPLTPDVPTPPRSDPGSPEGGDMDILSSWKMAMSGTKKENGTIAPAIAPPPRPRSTSPSRVTDGPEPQTFQRSSSARVEMARPTAAAVSASKGFAHPTPSSAPLPPGPTASTGPSPASSAAVIRENVNEFKNQLLRQLKLDPKHYNERAVLQQLSRMEASPSFSSTQKLTIVNSCVIVARGLRRRAVVEKLERIRRAIS